MKLITIVMLSFATIGSAQESKRTDAKEGNLVAELSKEEGTVRWHFADNLIFDDVKVLETRGVWAKIEYSQYNLARPRVVNGKSDGPEAEHPQAPRENIWVNTLHVIQIRPAAKSNSDTGRLQTTIIGYYVIPSEDSTPNVTSTLNVTSDTIVASDIASSGSVIMTYSYKVIGVRPNRVTVELGNPNQPNQPKTKTDIQVQNDSLLFEGKTWKRK